MELIHNMIELYIAQPHTILTLLQDDMETFFHQYYRQLMQVFRNFMILLLILANYHVIKLSYLYPATQELFNLGM